MAYERLEPFGPLRESGAVAAMLANVNRDRKSRPEPYTAHEALTMFRTEPVPPQPVDLATKIKTVLGNVGKPRRRRA